MKIIELDLTGCKSILDIHDRIKVAFEFPEWYGKNWDAFWDLMWSECDADRLIIKGESSLSKDFEDQIAIMHEVLDDTIEFRKSHNFNPFEYTVVS